MDCDICALAEAKPDTGFFRMQCLECSARQLAHGIDYAKSEAGRKITPEYLAALRAVFGEQWEAGHQRAKHWAVRILEARAAG